MNRVSKIVDSDSSYSVRTSSSVGLVRGTVFIVEVDAATGDAAWKTVEGTVRVARAVGPEVSVVAGTATSIQLGYGAAPPAPVPVTEDELPFLDAIEVVIEERDVEPPSDKNPEQERTLVAGPTPTLPPVGPPSSPPPEVTTWNTPPRAVAPSANRPGGAAPEGRPQEARPMTAAPAIAATAVAATMATDPETAIPGATGVATAIKAVQS